MPNFNFSDDEVEAITTALLGFVREKPKSKIVGEYFKNDYPASTMVEVRSLVNPDMLIEIEAIAVV